MEYILQRALYEDVALIVTFAINDGSQQFCGFVTKVNPYESGWRSPTEMTGKSFVSKICWDWKRRRRYGCQPRNDSPRKSRPILNISKL
jgi:hypothetical protein